MTPPAWMSISTGLSPAKHGVYDFWDFEQTESGLRPFVITHRKGGKAIWNILSEWGKQVVVANVPMTYPPEPNVALKNKRVGDTFTLAGETYKVIAISQNAVRVQATSNDKQTTIMWNGQTTP